MGGQDGANGAGDALAPAPVLGADTASLLAEIGIGAAELARLREEGIA